jgi:hypothetical protein
MMAASAQAQPSLRDIVRTHCVACHGPEKTKGRLRLDTLADPTDPKSRHDWERVYEAVRTGEMPPPERPPLSAEQRRQLGEWIVKGIRSTHRPTLVRRLTMDEIAWSLADLFSLDFRDVRPLLPDEGRQGTFGHVAERSGITPESHLQLMDAFDSLLGRLMAERDRPTTSTRSIDPLAKVNPKDRDKLSVQDRSPFYSKFRFQENGLWLSARMTRIDGALPDEGNLRDLPGITVLTTYDDQPVGMPKVHGGLPSVGLIKLRVRAGGKRGADGVPPRLLIAAMAGQFCDERIAIDVDAPPDAMKDYEVLVPYRLPEGPFALRRFPLSVYAVHGYEKSSNFRVLNRSIPASEFWKFDGLPELIINRVEVEIPYIAVWPPPGRAVLLGPLADKADDDGAREAFGQLLPRLWRRPVGKDELDRVFATYKSHRKLGAEPKSAYRATLASALASPSFLYLDGATPGSQHGLASRLSFALWGASPDKALTKLADAGMLDDPKTISNEARRMLADPRSKRFVESFVRQWLNLRPLDPSKIEDREMICSRDLRDAIDREPYETVSHLLATDGKIGQLFDREIVVCNDRLADHYGITGVVGDAYRPVPVPKGNPRGGLLSQAAVLHAMTGDASEPSWPIYRGSWVVRKILGMPLPDPPAGVPELSLSRSKSLREKLAKHTEDARCALCHRKMDPIGFGFQNFDAVGRWRDEQPNFDETGKQKLPPEKMPKVPCDVAGTLPRGESFASFAELREKLNDGYAGDLRRNFANLLACWMLGREISAADEPMIDRFANDLERMGLRSALVEFLSHEDFRRPNRTRATSSTVK